MKDYKIKHFDLSSIHQLAIDCGIPEKNIADIWSISDDRSNKESDWEVYITFPLETLRGKMVDSVGEFIDTCDRNNINIGIWRDEQDQKNYITYKMDKTVKNIL